MNYVSPRFAPLITPPASAIVERRPNGGLFLAAAHEPFQIANPTHLAIAREIEAALRPLNKIPYPIDDPYKGGHGSIAISMTYMSEVLS